MTYAGFFVNLSKIPPVLRWLRWFDVLGYALEATVVNEVGAGLEIVDSLAGGKRRNDNRCLDRAHRIYVSNVAIRSTCQNLCNFDHGHPVRV
jgi:hypothetical protein